MYIVHVYNSSTVEQYVFEFSVRVIMRLENKYSSSMDIEQIKACLNG
jgi:hypothetical protein